jgi:hypothetical protein
MRARRAALGLALVALASGLGCASILGVDFGDAHPRSTLLDGAAGDGRTIVDPNDEAGIGERTDAAPTGCKPDEKPCDGVCVKKDDPLHGCGGASCGACSLPFASEAKCSADGSCAVSKCAPGRGDCNGQASDGCEADLTSPATCTTCTTSCGGGTPLCTSSGCAASCPSGATQCGNSCVDLQTSPEHCGACGRKCAVVNNGSPACAAGRCTVSCNAGFRDCNDNPLDGCEPLTTFFLDEDGDRRGGPTTQLACAPPAPNWVTTGGDCHDGNPQVFPGQTAYFATSYTNLAGMPSFDYDCNGAEQEEGEPVHFVGGCGAACDNFGYLIVSPTRSGTGIDNYCGSVTMRECIDNNLNLQSGTPRLLPPGGCTAQNFTAPAIKCR